MAGDRYDIIRRDGSVLTVDPAPSGWEDPVIVLERDPNVHGIFFDYGLNILVFTGQAAEEIKAEYEEFGVNGQMGLRIWAQCSEDSLFEELYFGQMNFSTYKKRCGIECTVSIELESSGDIMSFRNNYEQKVNLLDNLAFDRITPLEPYPGLNFDLTVPSRELRVRLEGTATPGPFPIFPINTFTTGLFTTISVRPSYTQNQVAEIETADLTGESNYRVNPQNDPPLHPFILSPVLELTSEEGCTSGIFNYDIRLKGHVAETGSPNRSIHIQAVFYKGQYNDTTDPAIAKFSIAPTQTYLGPDGPDLDFDVSFTGSVPVEIGDQLRIIVFASVLFNGAGKTTNLYVTWDAATSVKLWTNTLCPPSISKAFMINEALSRTAEAVTNNRLKLYSNAFGRTDSQPYAATADSCAGMFAFTSGLNIRRKLLPDGTQPGVFVTMQQLFDDLNSMWNIGYTIEPDPNRPGFNRLRIEDWEYFYQNQVGFVLREATSIEKSVDLTRIYNQLLIGFDKWEAQKITGLDEFMTQRTYRVDITTLNNVLERICNMILSTYCIEETRRLSDTSQDWTYDNDLFGFCLRRGGDTEPPLTVEMMAEAATNILNILNPGTNYNFRVSPARNAMRWFNFIMQGLKQLDTEDKLYFSEGKGNYIARYKALKCNVEGSVLGENTDIGINNFALVDDAKPITFAETDTFVHPFSFNQFNRLRTDPTLMFKTMRYFCNGSGREGWIKRIAWRRSAGTAEIQAIPKNTLQIPNPVPPCAAFVYDLTVVQFLPENGVSIDWDDDFGDNWHWTLENQSNPGLNQSGISLAQAIIFTDLEAGNWTFTVQGYCGISPGQNIEQIPFEIVPIVPMIQLSAYKVFVQSLQEWKWRLLCEPVNTPTFVVHCEFFFKRCSFFAGLPRCNSPALGEWGEISTTVGAAYTTGDTWGAETEGSILLQIKIRLASLSGMTPDQIIKKPGETWTLTFE